MSNSPVIENEAAAGLVVAGGLRLSVDGPVATLTLARPERRNAMTPATWAGLAAVPALLGRGVRIVVVRGEGASFCAGLDLRLATPEGVPGEGTLADIVSDDQAVTDANIAAFQAGFIWLRDPSFVSIAAVQGHAVGAGFQLALAADLRVVAEDARFCMREVALGLVPDLTGTKALVDAVGYSRALEIATTARWVGAEESVRIGLASLAVAPADLEGAVGDLCAAILANSPAAVRATKGLLRDAGGRDLAGQAAAERVAQIPLLRAMTTGAAT